MRPGMLDAPMLHAVLMDVLNTLNDHTSIVIHVDENRILKGITPMNLENGTKLSPYIAGQQMNTFTILRILKVTWKIKGNQIQHLAQTI